MNFNFNWLKQTFALFICKRTWSYPGIKARFFLAVTLIVTDIAVASLVPYYSKNIVDILSLNLLESVWVSVLLLGLFWTLGKTVSHIQEIIFFPIINLTIRDLNFKVVEHIHHISLPDYHKLSIPEVINCTRRISFSARSFIKIVFLLIIPTFFKLLIAAIILLKAGLFGIWLIPALMIAMVILYKGTGWYAATRESAWQLSDKVITRISDSILNTKVIRSFLGFEMKKVGDLLHQEAVLWHKTNTRLHLIYIAIGTVLGVAITGILASVVLAIQNKTLTVGDFVMLQGQLIAAFLPLKSFSLEFRQLAESLVDIKKIIQIFEIPKQAENPSSLVYLTHSFQGIVFKDITFSHHEKNTIFDQLSLNIPAHRKIGIIGQSGCGKSTFLNLTAGLLRPNQGKIYIHGRDIHCIPKDEFKKIIHCIPQDFRLFNLSFRENITYGALHVTDQKLTKIASQIGLMPLIEQSHQGFDSLVGEMGIKLSGGEKQKIALARALLMEPEILLLDETTNSLNSDIEQEILNLLFSVIPTVILVSHRATTLKGLDQIFNIHHGQVATVPCNQTTESKLELRDA